MEDNRQLFAQALAPLLSDYLTTEDIYNLIEVPNHEEHGDLAFPTFTLARELRQSPPKIAQDLTEQMDTSNFADVQAMGPFINIKLKRAQTGQGVVHQILEEKSHYGDVDLGHGEKMVIDMSSPNIAKPMSMGHLRSTVIGNAIANIAKKVNYTPVRINHLGDWGTQFGRLIVAYTKWGDEEKVRANPVKELVDLYVKFHEELEEHPELEEEGREAFKRLEDGDKKALKLWQWFRDESLKEFERVYDLLGIEFDSNQGEAFYNDKMQAVIDELEDKHITTIDNGATLVKLEEEDLPPALIKRTDGATLYITRDLSAANYRKDNYDFAKAVYVVGNEQANHFRQMKAVLKRMGHDWSEDIVHVPFGLITLAGETLSTRQGKVVLLEDVLNEAMELAEKQITEKNPDLENKEAVAHVVGVGAVIFYDLKTDRMTGFDFDLDQIVQFEGETGPYVQYTYARSMSMLRRYGKDIDPAVDYQLDDDYSWRLIKQLADYQRTVIYAAESYEPSVVAKYAIHLAQAFNRYYANVRILEEDDQLEARVALVKAVTIVLKDALALLGLEAPEEM